MTRSTPSAAAFVFRNDSTSSVSQSRDKTCRFEVCAGTAFFEDFLFFVPAGVEAVFWSMFSFSNLRAYAWSVAIYCCTSGANVSGTMPAIPEPSSSTVDSADTMPCCVSMFPGEINHSANLGVTFHTTAPVVPPPRAELRTAGLCLMDRSRDPTLSSRRGECESIMPRF